MYGEDNILHCRIVETESGLRMEYLGNSPGSLRHTSIDLDDIPPYSLARTCDHLIMSHEHLK